METVNLSDYDRELLEGLTAELRHQRKKQEFPDVLISNKEAARILGVSATTISIYIRQKNLTKRTQGGVTGILLSELLKEKDPAKWADIMFYKL